MVPLLLCLGLALSPALAARVNRDEAPPAGPVTRLSAADLRRPPADRADRGTERGEAVAFATAEVTTDTSVEHVPPTTAAPASTTTAPGATTTHTHASSTTTSPAATTTTHTHAPATTTTRPAPTTTTTTAPPPPTYANAQEGAASWYQAAVPGSCAHRTIPKGTTVKVTNKANGAAVKCLVNDRGPYVDGRIIDLSEADFQRLAGSHEGVIQVLVQW